MTETGRTAAAIPVIINVTDVNEPPVVSGGEVVTYPENETIPVTTYTATDPEGDPLTWEVTGTDADLFDIAGGVLTFKSPPDFENPKDSDSNNVHNLTVTVSDGGLSDSLDITVAVTDVAIEVAEIQKTVGVNCKEAVNYAENGRGPVQTCTATKPDSEDDLIWILTGPDADLFDIDGGVLTFKSPPDYENPKDSDEDNEYTVTVTLTVVISGVSVTVTKDVTVTVTDVNEPPAIKCKEAVNYAENGRGPVQTCTATDPDSEDDLIWTLTGPDDDLFDIDGGVLTFKSPPDFENPKDWDSDNDYTVTVTLTVVISGVSVTVTKDVTVTVTDVNEPPPKVTRPVSTVVYFPPPSPPGSGAPPGETLPVVTLHLGPEAILEKGGPAGFRPASTGNGPRTSRSLFIPRRPGTSG